MASEHISLGLLELSAVREMANIGLGHATKSLSEITGHNFNMDVPYAESVALTRLPTLLGGGEQTYAGIYMPVTGDVEGHIAFLFPWESAQSLWTMLLGGAPNSPEDIDELAASALLEIGNIINGSFLNAIADMAGFNLNVTPPVLAIDMCAVILAAIVSEASQGDSIALAIETSIFDEAHSTSGIFIYIPTISGLRSLFGALGIPEAA
jgi:chemotaxis protein CheC